MPQHHEKRNLPYTPEQLFDLVAGIEKYPEFLPWCKAARIIERKGNKVTADLIIGYKMFQETFRSLVTLERPYLISVEYHSGPLSHLNNNWKFIPDARGGCDIDFNVDFDFRSPLLAAVMGAFFDKAFIKMVNAFDERAKALYG